MSKSVAQVSDKSSFLLTPLDHRRRDAKENRKRELAAKNERCSKIPWACAEDPT